MHTFFIGAGLALLTMMAVVFYRVVFGPTVIDRIVGLNITGTKTVVLLIIIGALTAVGEGDHLGNNIGMYVDFAITYALLNFVGALAAAKFFVRHKSLDEESTKPEVKA